jgi:hypothetical protein
MLFQWIFSLGTALNILVLGHIRTEGVLRAGIDDNYMTSFGMADFVIFIVLSIAVYLLIAAFRKWCIPVISKGLKTLNIECLESFFDNCFRVKIFSVIFICWFFFFLVFYPGTAMNDTINICSAPNLLTNQHPAMYVFYTYFFYKIGLLCNNPNLGLALLSIFQIVWMDYVVTYGIMVFNSKGASKSLCVILAVYFGIAPLFATYAISAIKDTPFSIAVFWLMIILYEASDEGGKVFVRREYQVKIWICVFIMAGFRSNGLLIAVGTGFVVFVLYGRYRKATAIIFATSIVSAVLLNSVLTPDNVEKLFQERVGIPLQQVAAVVNKGNGLTDEQKQYLFRLLPEKNWSSYGTGCTDNIKWNSDFDREYLNDTKDEFIKIWLELMPDNIGVYAEAYILNTYGIWGIETRNGEQYYEKKIYDNDIGLYQDSPLPDVIASFFNTYYCNRFTYRYLSEGTSFWVMFGLVLWLIYHRKYIKAAVFTPMAINFVSLMLATPIAFAFRYVFTMALIFPFMILLPFINNFGIYYNNLTGEDIHE